MCRRASSGASVGYPAQMLSLLLLPSALAIAPTCTSWAEPVLLAECESTELSESSGLAWSRNRPGVWFTHNDAGGSARLYAFTEDGTHIGSHDVLGGGFRDWEDMTTGPCPDGIDADPCIYIGDVGDNGSTRAEVEVFVVPEPEADEPVNVLTSWRLRYPGSARDAEAIAVHPCTGDVTIVTKARDGAPEVFRLPSTPTGVESSAEALYVASLPRDWFRGSGLITSADWSAAGDRFVVRTYDGAWIWETDPADPDGHWSVPPTEVPIDIAGQGETIAFHPDGGLLTTTERVPMRIVRQECLDSIEAPECPPPDEEPGDTGTAADTGEPDDSGEPVDTDEPDEDTDEPDVVVDSGTTPAAGMDDGETGGKDTSCGSAGGALALLLIGLPAARRRREHPTA